MPKQFFLFRFSKQEIIFIYSDLDLHTHTHVDLYTDYINRKKILEKNKTTKAFHWIYYTTIMSPKWEFLVVNQIQS